MSTERLTETVTLSQAKTLIRAMAHDQSLLLLSAPGVGKSDTVRQAAQDADLECRSLLGTQIAPEDVSGIPRIVGERSVFCPPRILLPEKPEPFCLFLDELPAATPDIQKAFYSLLLERRLGEHDLPKGTWVVAAGNRAEDRALVRTLSSALVNRVIILNIRVDVREWLQWAKGAGIRSEIISFITLMPQSLMRDVPREPVPFSTPRAWTALSRALDLAQGRGQPHEKRGRRLWSPRAGADAGGENILSVSLLRALTFGTVSAEDAAVFCALSEEQIGELKPVRDYIEHPENLPATNTARWFILNRVRSSAAKGELDDMSGDAINAFLNALPDEFRFALLVDMVETWARLGAEQAMFDSLAEVTGLDQ